jgi:hypothetical protein
MRSIVCLFALAACGGSSSPADPGPIKPLAPEHVVNADVMCKRIQELHDAHCGLFGAMELRATCPQEVSGTLTDSRLRPMTEQMDICTSELTVCSDIAACVGQLDAATETRTCNDHSEREAGQPVGLPYAEWRTAMKHGVAKYSEVTSTKDKPIELCGSSTENWWLAALACEDGSHPFADNAAAQLALLGNVGAGGRCGSPVDHYRVRCPEREYDLYLDGYVCPEPQ